MSKPGEKYVTRAVLEEVLDKMLEQKLEKERARTDERFKRLDERFEAFEQRFATKIDLDLMLGAIMARFDKAHADMRIDLARHTRSSETALRSDLAAVDDHYRDLPERVTRLEDHVGINR